MTNTDLEAAIIEHISRPNYRPVKPSVMARQLGLPKGQAAEVRKAVKRLVRAGTVKYGSKHLVQPITGAAAKSAAPAESSTTEPAEVKPAKKTPAKRTAKKRTAAARGAAGRNRIVGVFHRTSKGFGFVKPSGATDPEAPDVYIPANKSGDAATGDVVLVQLSRQRGGRRPGPRGEIIDVVERETNQFVGTYFEAQGTAFVKVDGTLFSKAIEVGDPGAKAAGIGDKVVFEMVRFPSHIHDGEGVITEVLGPRGAPGVDTQSIIREFCLPGDFAEDALQQARDLAEEFDNELDGGAIPDGRLDITDLTILTIDPADARDFDDAISLEKLDGGHWRLGVHIADVSHFVQPNTALDREAQDRATSVYLPDQVIPMIPEIISNGLASLQPRKVRYTKTAFIEFTPEGQRTSVELHSAAIKSNKRLNYEQVDEFIADPAPWRRKLGVKVHELLSNMHELAMILRARRFKHGALEMSMPEVKIDLDRRGKVTGAHVTENTESHQIIEEFMLAANEAVADTLHEKELAFLRRIHMAPTPRKLKALTEFVTELGFKTGSLEDRFELQKLLDKVEGLPQQHAVNFAVLRSMQRAVYGPEEEGHFALASRCYCHFTSPIRRYPDLTVHRLVEAILLKRKPRLKLDDFVVLGRHCSERERRAETAERELIKLKLLHYLEDKIGEEMDAVVTGVQSFGLFVQGVELPAEGLIHAESLTDDYYHYDQATHTLAGHRSGNVFRLGDLVRVVVARVDMDRRELDFRLAPSKKKRKRAVAKKRRGKRSK